MKLFKKAKDGGPESHVTGYWLIEWKRFFSIALLKFEDGSRDAYHTHAFNALSFLFKGHLKEQLLDGNMSSYTRWYHPRWWKPILTRREDLHKVTSYGTSWVLTFRGPWVEMWQEYDANSGESTLLTHGRKVV